MDAMELLKGAVDMHVHTGPDQIDRWGTDLAVGRAAMDVGMKGVVVKNHVVPTMDRATVVNEALDEEILLGGVVLNGAVGGLNPEAVRVALSQDAAVVWLPTTWNAYHATIARNDPVESLTGFTVPGPDKQIEIVNDGSVTPQIQTIIEILATSDAILATGHSSPEAIRAVVEGGADAGVPVVVTHPFFHVIDLSINEQEFLAERGATLEFCAYSLQNTPEHSIDRIVEAVRRVGAESCMLATDYGQADNPPVAGFAKAIDDLLEAGLDYDTVDQLVRRTPARLIDS